MRKWKRAVCLICCMHILSQKKNCPEPLQFYRHYLLLQNIKFVTADYSRDFFLSLRANCSFRNVSCSWLWCSTLAFPVLRRQRQGGSGVQSHPWLHSEFEASLGDRNTSTGKLFLLKKSVSSGGPSIKELRNCWRHNSVGRCVKPWAHPQQQNRAQCHMPVILHSSWRVKEDQKFKVIFGYLVS